ncbi:hypothetical protein MMA231_00950 [Asticcacaulis sp. MM231]|uniref:hypothetical protein n=1 Tax=Asticcacaulis sp. MM231 TaxID=3157666 RepID=UPI0032D57274
MSSAAPLLDLIAEDAHQELVEVAREDVRAAEEARDKAERDVLRAPQGKVKARWALFYRAAHTLLKAEITLSRLMKESANG